MIFNCKRPCILQKQISKIIVLIGILFLMFFLPALNAAANKLYEDLVVEAIEKVGGGLIEDGIFVNKDLLPYMRARIVGKNNAAINIYLFHAVPFTAGDIENKQLMNQVADMVVNGLVDLKTAIAKSKPDIAIWRKVSTGIGPVYMLLIFSSAVFLPEDSDVINQTFGLIKDGLIDKDALIAEDGTSLLMLASLIGDDEIVSDLLKMGADPNKARESDGKLPLVAAVLNGYDEAVKALLENRADVDCVDEDGNTVLILATKEGDAKIVEMLLKNKANPNLTNKEKLTALMIASDMGYVEIAKALLEKGATADLADENGETALMFASAGGYIEIVKMLLEKEVDLNKVNGDKRTSLMLASLNKRPEVVASLLEKEAATNLADKDGKTALMLACSIDFTELHLAKKGIGLVYPYTKKRTEIVKMLLEKMVEENVDLADKKDWTALMFASEGGYIEIIKMLLEKDVDVNKINSDKRTSLMLASLNNRLEVVKALFGKAEINLVDKDDWTALMFASSNGFNEIVEELILMGADISIKDKKGMNALMLASEQGNDEVEKTLGKKKESSTNSDNKKYSKIYVISYAPDSESRWTERYNSFPQKESFLSSAKMNIFCFYYAITSNNKKEHACWSPPT